MEPLKRLLSTHPQIFSLLGIALLLDLSGVMSSIMPGASFALGSVFVFAYFLGVSGILRFGIARRPIDLALSWVAIVILYLGWFGIQAALNERPYRPSLLFFLCAVAAFKMMRFRDTPTTTAAETSPASEKRDETTEPDCLISSDDLPPPIPPELRHASRPSAGSAWDRVTVKPNQLLPLLLGFLICTVVILGVALGWQAIEIRDLRGRIEAAEEHIDSERDERIASYVKQGDMLLHLIKRDGESSSEIADMDTAIKKLTGTLNFLHSENDDDSARIDKLGKEVDLLNLKMNLLRR